jgi:hypothetical protein
LLALAVIPESAPVIEPVFDPPTVGIESPAALALASIVSGVIDNPLTLGITLPRLAADALTVANASALPINADPAVEAKDPMLGAPDNNPDTRADDALAVAAEAALNADAAPDGNAPAKLLAALGEIPLIADPTPGKLDNLPAKSAAPADDNALVTILAEASGLPPGKLGNPGKLGSLPDNASRGLANMLVFKPANLSLALLAVALAASLAADISLNVSGFIFSLASCCKFNLAMLGNLNAFNTSADAFGLSPEDGAIPGKFTPLAIADETAAAGSRPKADALALTATNWSKLNPLLRPADALDIADATPPVTEDTCDCSWLLSCSNNFIIIPSILYLVG